MLKLIVAACVSSSLFLSLATYAQSGAFLVGQQKAKDLWNQGVAAGTYTCDGMSSVLDPTGPFITDARAEIKDASVIGEFESQPARFWRNFLQEKVLARLSRALDFFEPPQNMINNDC
jgi:hypothetical protein